MKEMIAELTALLSDIPDQKSSMENEPAENAGHSARLPTAYGWHDPHFPPEYRRACLRGNPCEMDIHTKIYILMAEWYEKISGKRAPCDFTVYRRWKEQLRASDTGEIPYTAEEKEKIIRAIEIGTRHRKEERDPLEILRVLGD